MSRNGVLRLRIAGRGPYIRLAARQGRSVVLEVGDGRQRAEIAGRREHLQNLALDLLNALRQSAEEEPAVPPDYVARYHQEGGTGS